MTGTRGRATGDRWPEPGGEPYSSPMSSFQISGCSRMKSAISVEALGRIEVHDLDAARAQQVLAAHERAVLADHEARDAVQEDRAGAHVARRERRRHRGAAVGGRGEPARHLEGVRLAVPNRAPELHAPVVPGTDDDPVDEDRRADRDAALGAPDPGLLDRDLEECGVVHAATVAGSNGDRD